ncbi:hypothetical protein [Kitasatospora sp. NPDC001175]
MAIRHVRRQDYDELTVLAQESAEMLRRWLGAREDTVEAFETGSPGRRACGGPAARDLFPDVQPRFLCFVLQAD